MQFLDQDIAPLGMGCWPIGGAMYSGDEQLGYANSDDAESIRTIHAALDGGIRLFDTAAAYGAGHAERLLGQALVGRDALVVTKIGIGIDEKTRQLSFGDIAGSDVGPAIDACLRRLNRDCIDVVLLHQNAVPVDKARPLFEAMEQAREQGKIRAYGWSTDFPDSARAMAGQGGFKVVQHAMNVLVDAPRMQAAARDCGLVAMIRSPLAMGLLSGKYKGDHRVPSDDIRAGTHMGVRYFEDGAANPAFEAQIDAIREILMQNGRSLVQGALAWLWGRGEMNLPIPGARTAEQMTGLVGAIEKGPLLKTALDEIETLIVRDEDDLKVDRPR